MDYYEDVAGQNLANDFYAELKVYFQKAVQSPESYTVRKSGLRRVNLVSFPYHFFFRIIEDRVRILVVRHHKRRPKFRLERR